MRMTENEIKESKEWLQDFIRMFGCNFDDLEARSFNEIVAYLEELQAYRAIGTIDEFKTLKEKNEPKKVEYAPTDDTCLYSEYVCPNCYIRLPNFKQEYCKCGQKLDFGKEE